MKSRPGKPIPSNGGNTVDVLALLRKIDFTPDNVVEAAAINSVLYVDAITYRLKCLEEKSQATMNAKRVRAETELGIRKKAKANDEKITENYISALLTIDPGVEEATKLENKADIYDEYSKQICDVFRMRRDCLKIVGDLVKQELYVNTERMELNEVRKKLKDKFPG
jgi:HD superfamily phosphodiesterase